MNSGQVKKRSDRKKSSRKQAQWSTQQLESAGQLQKKKKISCEYDSGVGVLPGTLKSSVGHNI